MIWRAGDMICFFSNGEDDAAEEGLIFSQIFLMLFLILIDFFRCSNLSSFSKLVSYRNLFCRIFSVYVVGASPLELVDGTGLCAPFAMVVSGDIGHAIWSFHFVLPMTCHSPFSFSAISQAVSKDFSGIGGPRNWPGRRFYHTGPGCRHAHYRQTEITDTVKGARTPDAFFSGQEEERSQVSPYSQSQWTAFSDALHPDSWGRRWRLHGQS